MHIHWGFKYSKRYTWNSCITPSNSNSSYNSVMLNCHDWCKSTDYRLIHITTRIKFSRAVNSTAFPRKNNPNAGGNYLTH